MMIADAVVVGAGPVGLLTALELRLRGLNALVLERLDKPSLTIKALGVGPIGGETLQRRGMATALDAAEAESLAATDGGAPMRPRMGKLGGHFGGLTGLRRDLQPEPGRRMRMVNQQSLETMLGARVAAMGIEVRRGCTLTGFTAGDDAVAVEWASPAGTERARCAFLVGCDGGRSTVRKAAGFGFPGTPPTMTMYQAVLTLDHPERLGSMGWQRTSGGVFAYGPFPGRLFMLDFSGPPADRDAPVLRDEVERVLRRISGAEVRVNALEVANRWTDNTRLVDEYRRGRVLLVGDAAHVHAPFGGQGLSLGLGDAANLGWKLAAVIRGEGGEDLLDTYEAERRPVAEAVLANTLAQVAIMRPDPQSGAMRDLMAILMGFDDVNRYLGATMSGLGIRYDLGSARDEVGRLHGDRAVRDGDRDATLFDVMREGAGVFLDADGDPARDALVATAAPAVRRVRIAAGPSMVLRPDACVAWAGDGGSADGLEAALRRWFGRAGPSCAAGAAPPPAKAA